jgi:neutral ceramidase
VALGPLTIAAVPTESSTSVGAAIRAALAKPQGSPDLVQLVGLANEYASYVASRDEYMRQDYMGASTLWGPDEGAFFACRLAALRDTGVPYPPGSPRITLTYHPGPAETQLLDKEPFGPSFCGDMRAAPDEELEDILVEDKPGPFPGRSPARDLPWFSWNEAARDSGGGAGHGTVPDDFRSTSCRVVAVDQMKSGQWTPWVGTETPDDGAGSGFVTTLLYGADKPGALSADSSGGAPAVAKEPEVLWRRYAALWLAPLFERPDSLTVPFRFRVRLPDGTTLCQKDTTHCPALPPPPSCPPAGTNRGGRS